MIFDCDGVLVDSERITNRVFAELLNELGLSVTLEDMFEHFVGSSMADCLVKIAGMLGRPPPPDLAAAYWSRSAAVLDREVGPVPGVADALARIAIPWCVASNGARDKMRLTLDRSGLLPRFDGRLFSARDVAHPKPAPDVFLHAAASCGVVPRDCIVVEDSPTGVAGGVAAGMTVFGFAAMTPAHRLRTAGAHRVFEQMSELPQLLAAHAAG